MPRIESLQMLLVEELKDLYDAEQRLTKAIPKMAKAATNAELKTAFSDHLAETETHVTRLEEAFEHLDTRPRAKACAGMRGIIEEGETHLKEDFTDDSLRDAMLIGAAQRVEHYEIAAYGTAIAHARQLSISAVVDLLEQTLEEEKATDQALTDLAVGLVNVDAST